MTTNLLDLFGGAVGDNLAGPAARLLGESSTALRSAADMFLPAIVGQLAKQGSTVEGASDILKTLAGPGVEDGAGAAATDAMNGGSRPDSLLTHGSSLARGLFGDRLGAVTDSVASVAGIRGSSASTLLSMAVPMVLGSLKRHVADEKLDASGLSQLLVGQSAHVRNSLDPRVATAAGLATPAPDPYLRPPVRPIAAAPSRRRSILPWVSLAVAAVLLLALWRNWQRSPEPTPVATTPVVTDTTTATSAAEVAPTPGALPASLYFDVGDAKLGAASDQILTTVATTIKADGSKIAITGYTDRTGDAAKNADLAKHRAQAVRDGLLAAGVGPDKIELRPPAAITGSGSEAEARRVEITRVQ